MKASAPGTGTPSCMSTPSMSVSHDSMGLRSVMGADSCPVGLWSGHGIHSSGRRSLALTRDFTAAMPRRDSPPEDRRQYLRAISTSVPPRDLDLDPFG